LDNTPADNSEWNQILKSKQTRGFHLTYFLHIIHHNFLFMRDRIMIKWKFNEKLIELSTSIQIQRNQWRMMIMSSCFREMQLSTHIC
jgi:hypothetical protein